MLPQLNWGILASWKYLRTICLDHVVLREGPLAFEVLYLYKYFQKFTKLVGIDIALDSFLSLKMS